MHTSMVIKNRTGLKFSDCNGLIRLNEMEITKTYKGPQFKRLLGVERETFDIMVSELKRLKPHSGHKVPSKKRGPKAKLSVAEEVVMTLILS